MEKFKESESVIIFKVETESTKIETVLKTDFNISSRLFSKLIKTDGMFLNEKLAHRKDIATTGDKVAIVLADEEDTNVKQSDIPIEIVYEDMDIIIVNKLPNYVVHPTKNHPYGTILNGMSYYFEQKEIKKKVRFVNRLDRDTSGLLVIAKNSFGHQQMCEQFIEDTVEKGYMALVDGIMESDEGVIDLPIGKADEDSIHRIVREDGKESRTRYKVLERFKNTTLLSLRIETGRTHQIRVHLSHIGHPIVGDPLYNNESELIERQALHSYYLKFKHLRTGNCIEVTGELPKDIQNVVEEAKKREI